MSISKVYAFYFTFCILLDGVDASTRRRRRNLYNDRPCSSGEHAILSASKKLVVSCEPCKANTYRVDVKHSLEECLVCEAGRYSSSDFTRCLGDICAKGTYGSLGSDKCSVCPAGKYSITGQFTCNECESGRHNNHPGSSDCLGDKCPSGKYGLLGQTSSSSCMACDCLSCDCLACDAGKWSTNGAGSCSNCIDGKYSSGDSAECSSHESCPSGSYYANTPSSTSSDISCSKCIYASDVYTAAYLFSLIVSITYIIVFFINPKKYCCILVFVIVSGIFALSLFRCNSKPGDQLAIIAIVIDTIFLINLKEIISVKAFTKKPVESNVCTRRAEEVGVV